MVFGVNPIKTSMDDYSGNLENADETLNREDKLCSRVERLKIVKIPIFHKVIIDVSHSTNESSRLFCTNEGLTIKFTWKA